MNAQRAALSLLLLAASALGAAAEISPRSWQPEAGDVIRFNVLREGKPFGSHAVTFEKAADGTLVANTKVSLKAGLGPVTVFRYQLDATEKWLNGKLVEVSGKLNDDGKKATLSARRKGEALNVDSTVFNGVAPAGTVPASHWNYAQTQTTKLISTGNGEILNVKVVNKGRETIKAGNRSIEANRYLLDSALDVDLWYDDEGRWVKLAFEARGQQIEYVLDALY
ncbi:MAG: DUF6134 family protein [Hyphomonas sp.]|uniref:DUF6134 family protein n=1 Tax=Hyphomonas sp. TaxID=87 RepID=UPI00349FE597